MTHCAQGPEEGQALKWRKVLYDSPDRRLGDNYTPHAYFLDAIELHGKNIKTVIDPLEELDEKKTVAYEGKLLKRMFLKLRE